MRTIIHNYTRVCCSRQIENNARGEVSDDDTKAVLSESDEEETEVVYHLNSVNDFCQHARL